MRKIQYLLLIIILTILGSIIILHAQEDCDVEDAEKVIEVVTNVCENIGDNQICYGNFEVGTDWLDDFDEFDLLDIIFETPGDVTDVEYIKSLYLSALDPEEDTWGIAQLRLLTPSRTGAQELNLLLFGDVEVENAVEPTRKIDLQVGEASSHVRNLPSVNSIILQGAYPESTLIGVGRLEDNSWVRVETERGIVGWIATNLVSPINEGESIEDLEIQDDTSPYFGPMQAFVFEQGAGSACGNLNTDGLVIQTPQGPANVNVSINGVNIDLIPVGENGAAAYIETGDNGTTISQIAGNSLITSGGTTYHMSPGEQTTIGASGIPSIPNTYDTEDLNIPGLSSISPIDTSDPAIDIMDDNTPTPEVDIVVDATAIPIGDTSGTSGTGDTGDGGNNNSDDDCKAANPANPNACDKKK